MKTIISKNEYKRRNNEYNKKKYNSEITKEKYRNQLRNEGELPKKEWAFISSFFFLGIIN